MTAVLSVEQAGPLTTLQDAGRPGHMRFGVTASGPVDRQGFAAAQVAVGNPAAATAVEVSLGGIVLRCVEGEVGFALAGGDFAASVNGVALGGWVVGVLRAGSRLVVREGRQGNWATLALAGTIESRRWLGSAATLALAGLGGGRLAAGDTLRVASPGLAVPRSLPPPPLESGPIRIVIGPQEQYFDAGALAALVSEPFAAGAAFDRMGMVLAGPALVPSALDMLSAPLVRGGLQVNGAGVATVLLADHQTSGGYPRIATVISADVDRLAQYRTGTAFRFAAVSVADAIAAARARAAAEAAWLAAVASVSGAAVPGALADRLLDANLIDGVVDART